MLLKEYRVCMPLSVEEYRIGQLYMIARHSAEESRGSGDGVEVVVNESCHDDKHGDGQYTEKRIYLSRHMPAWTRSMIPRIFYITEKAWNFYPFTKTEYTCSFVPKLLIEIETTYENNNGNSENLLFEGGIYFFGKPADISDGWIRLYNEVEVSMGYTLPSAAGSQQGVHVYITAILLPYKMAALDLSPDLLTQREVVHVDIAVDGLSSGEKKPELDCTKFQSKKTGRGPLKEGWRDTSQPVMCSYKVVKVFFEIWGLQGRVETAVHKAIRDILITGHQQAFVWMDEWFGMELDDVRTFESKLQQETNRKVLEGVELQEEESA